MQNDTNPDAFNQKAVDILTSEGFAFVTPNSATAHNMLLVKYTLTRRMQRVNQYILYTQFGEHIDKTEGNLNDALEMFRKHQKKPS